MGFSGPNSAAGLMIVRFSMMVFTLMMLIINGTSAAAERIEIRLHPKADVRGAQVRLGNIADVRCDLPELEQKLMDLVVGNSPLPGRSRSFKREYIRLRLRQLGLDPDRATFSGVPQVRVTREYIEIDPQKVNEIISEYFRQNKLWGDATTVRIKRIDIVSDPILPKGKVTYRLVPPRQMKSLQTLPFTLVFDVDGTFQKELRVMVRLDVLAPVVVSVRPIGRLKPIEREDIRLQVVNLGEMQTDIFTRIDDVLGKRAKRSIHAETVLRSDQIEVPPTVKRGDVVMIVAESAGLRITALGEVKSAGRRGERIRVVNLDSNQRVFARVVDENTVKVDY